MSNHRRRLNSIHTTIARKQGVNAAAWFAGQSFTSAHRGDMPLTRLTDKQLNEAGAGLLPRTEPEPVETPHCIYCGVACFQSAPLPYCSTTCAINAASDNQEDR